ncbi:MAG TPA: DUF4190 domain-containing protein [Chthoniobacter sp.]|jgi:hypothetical protein
MDSSRADYYLLWKGRQTGPFSLAVIREKLDTGEINRMHQIGVEGRWVVLGDFLEQYEGGMETRLRSETARHQAEAAQREEQLRREYEARIAAERAQQSALQERLAEAEKRSLAQSSPRSSSDTPPSLSYAPVPSAASSRVQSSPADASHPAAASARTNGVAIAAFVLSICNFIPLVNLVSWILAIVLGHIALSQTERDPTLGGRRFAIAALIITYSLLAIGLIAFLVVSVLYGFNLHRFMHR